MRTRPPRITIHAERVEMLKLSAIKPYAKNARKHPEGQIKALAATIRQSGFTAPLIIDDENTLISGHGRALAAKALGMALVPCVRAKGLSDAQVRALPTQGLVPDGSAVPAGARTTTFRSGLDSERVRGIEPPFQAWEACVLPLNHTRVVRPR